MEHTEETTRSITAEELISVITCMGAEASTPVLVYEKNTKSLYEIKGIDMVLGAIVINI